MSTVGNKSYTWTLLKCAHVFSASTFLLTDLPNLFLWGIKQLLHALRKNFLCRKLKKKKKNLHSISWVYGSHRGNMRPTQWPAECQLSLGAPALESQYSLKLGCPWCIRSWWLHPSRTFNLILLFLSRPPPLFFHSRFAQASCMNLVSNENSIEKWNQGGVLGRSPAGCTLGIFYFTLNPILSTIIFGGRVVVDLITNLFFLRGDIYIYLQNILVLQAFLFKKRCLTELLN